MLVESGMIESLEFVRPDEQTFLDVEVTAKSAELAQATANELAVEMVEGDRAFRSTPLIARQSALTTLLTELDVDLAALDATIATATSQEAFAEANRFGTDAETLERLTVELRQAQDSRSVNVRRRNILGDFRERSAVELVDVELELETLTSSTRVVRRAVLPTTPDGASPDVVALAAFALGALVQISILALLSDVGRSAAVEP